MEARPEGPTGRRPVLRWRQSLLTWPALERCPKRVWTPYQAAARRRVRRQRRGAAAEGVQPGACPVSAPVCAEQFGSGRCDASAAPGASSAHVPTRVALSTTSTQRSDTSPWPRRALLHSRHSRPSHFSPPGLPSRQRCPPPRVAQPDPVVERHLSETDPLWFTKRQKKYDWWRSSWNPLDWDAEEWFASGKQHAPWVEHTLALIEEGWDKLTYEEPPPLMPTRQVHPPPRPLTLFEVWCKHRVDARRAKEDAASDAMWDEIGKNEATHHDIYRRDVRIKATQKEFPNYKPREQWTKAEIEALIACPPGVLEACEVHDPRWRADYSGMRKPGLDDMEFLAQTGRLKEHGTVKRDAGKAARSLSVAAAAGQAGEEGEAGGGEWEGAPGDDFDSVSAEDLSEARDIGGDDEF